MARHMQSEFPGTCVTCGNRFPKGEYITYHGKDAAGKSLGASHAGCKPLPKFAATPIKPKPVKPAKHRRRTPHYAFSAPTTTAQVKPVVYCQSCGSPHAATHYSHCSVFVAKPKIVPVSAWNNPNACASCGGMYNVHRKSCMRNGTKPVAVVPAQVAKPIPAAPLSVRNPPKAKAKFPEHKLPSLFAACLTMADVEAVVKAERAKADIWKSRGNSGAVKDILCSLAWQIDQLGKHPKFRDVSLPVVNVDDETRMPQSITAADVW